MNAFDTAEPGSAPGHDELLARLSPEDAALAGVRLLSHDLGHDILLAIADLNDGASLSLTALDEAETQRMARFRFERDARRYGSSHARLRLLLGKVCSRDPGQLRWREGPFGKPHLVPPDALHFNLSHSGEHALFGLCESRPIGVDIEGGTHLDDIEIDELARRCFTTSECEALARAPDAERRVAFLRCWTRKEACLKALGSGLSIEPGTFEAGIDSAQREVRISVGREVCRMTVSSLDAGQACAAAVALVDASSRHLTD